MVRKYIQIEEAEMICRMVEAFVDAARPEGYTAQEALREMNPEARYCWVRVSRAVQEYISEQVSLAETVH